MSLAAMPGQVLVRWDKPVNWQSDGTFLLPVLQRRREMQRARLKEKAGGYDVMDLEKDIIRLGELIDGDTGYETPIGTYVYFNRHDADEFEHEGETFFRVFANQVLAYKLSTPQT